MRFLDQRDDIAHAEDARGEPLWVERVEVVGLLPGPDELDGDARYGLDGERGTASSVAVELREHESGELKGVVEHLRHVHGLLAQCSIRDKEHLVGRGHGTQASNLVHQAFVDLQPTCSIKDDRVGSCGQARCESCLPDCRDILRLVVRVEPKFLLARKDFKLVYGRGTVDVAGHHKGLVPSLLEQTAQLGRRGRLPGAVEADHHDLDGT